MPSEPFYPTRQGPPAIRLSFGHLPVNEAKEGIRRLAAGLGKLTT
jgi:DNA-binding transcriptional MocR family regulator